MMDNETRKRLRKIKRNCESYSMEVAEMTDTYKRWQYQFLHVKALLTRATSILSSLLEVDKLEG